jgi:hypothetical protein
MKKYYLTKKLKICFKQKTLRNSKKPRKNFFFTIELIDQYAGKFSETEWQRI